MFQYYNPNPDEKQVGDCTIRAISKALGQEWQTTYIWTALYGLMLSDMPTANSVWGAYLRSRGWERRMLPETCPDCYTVEDFARDHPKGKFLLALAGHVVCVIDGDWYDTWDSGKETPIYYWKER